MFSLGPSTQPHYALFCDDDRSGRLDPDFIAVRLTEATRDALQHVEALGFTRALMGLLAAGPSRTDEPPYCLVAQLSGIRAFASEARVASPGLRSVGIHVIDDQAWSALMQGRIPVLDLLTSQLARVLVRVSAPGGSVEEFALSVPHGTTIGEVLAIYQIKEEGIRIEARPWPPLAIASPPLSQHSTGQSKKGRRTPLAPHRLDPNRIASDIAASVLGQFDHAADEAAAARRTWQPHRRTRTRVRFPLGSTRDGLIAWSGLAHRPPSR